MIKRLLTALLFIPFCTFAQAPKYSNEFLQIGVGARAFGMGGSVAASVSDVNAAYWNPAGLVNMQSDHQLSLMHSEYFAGVAKYDYAAFATFVADKTAVVSASFIRFGVDDIPDTNELIDADGNINYDRVKSFSAADYAFLFSYARNSKKFINSLVGFFIFCRFCFSYFVFLLNSVIVFKLLFFVTDFSLIILELELKLN